MFPIGDDNPTRERPVVTLVLIAACILAYLWQMTLPEREALMAILSYGFIPAVFFGPVEPLPQGAPPWLTVVTSMFLHGGFMHLAGNMLFLWIFGNNVEDSMGHGRFVLFYALCGAAAALGQGLADLDSMVPMIGASGAISGVLGAYLLLYPHARVRVLLFLGFFITTFRLPALVVLGLWFGMQFLSAAFTPMTEESGVAFWAHVGGFVAGMALIPVFKRRHIPFFGRRRGPWG